MKVTVIPIGAFGIVSTRLIQRQENFEIRGRVKPIQTTAYTDMSPGELRGLPVT